MEIVELRVHGVHGTSPGSMLGVSDGEVGQVAGDSLTGLYRADDPGDLPYRDLAGTRVSVEAYSWGALTSGVQGVLGWLKRALWLLLLPFALANLAYWARLGVGRPTGTARWGARAVRVSGLLLTSFMVLTPCVIAIDMVTWQCYRFGAPACSRLPTQLDVLAGWSPTQRLAAGTLVPMLLVALLWFLSRQSLMRYEAPFVDPWGVDDSAPVRPILRDPDLWQGKERTQRLQRLHLSVGVCTVVGFSGAHVLAAADAPVTVLATTVAAALVALAAIFLATVSHRTDLENRPPVPHPTQTRVWSLVNRCERGGFRCGEWLREHVEPRVDWLLVAALAVYAVHVLVLIGYRGDIDQSIDYYGRNLWFIAVFVLLTVLHLSVFAGGRMPTPAAIGLVVLPVVSAAVAAAYLFSRNQFRGDNLLLAVFVVLSFFTFLTLWHYRMSGRPEQAWHGAGASVLLAGGAWVSLLLTSGTVIASANYLNGPEHSVGDLVSHSAAPGASTASGATPTRFVATGDVTLVHAEVTVDGAGVTLHGGTVRVDGLSALDDLGTSAVVRARASTRVLGGELLVRGDSVAFQDSCVGIGSGDVGWLDEPCTAESARFGPLGTLAVPGRLLHLDPDSAVLLDNTNPPQATLVVPQVLIWTPIAQLAWLLLVGLVLIASMVLYGRTAGRLIGDFLPAEDGPWPDSLVPVRDRAGARAARRTAGMAHRAERLLDLMGLVTAPVALVLIVMAASGEPPWFYAEWTRSYATLAMYVVVAMSAGLALLGSQLRRSENARKAAGVLWDLTTFWPRAAHPLAPPCYAERVVPELETRTRWALGPADAPEPRLVVLSGHSQGSLIVAAMASRLGDDDLARVRIVTYGSQIRDLYGRVFPRVFGPDAIGYAPTTGVRKLRDPFPDVPREDTPGIGVPPPGSLLRRLTDHGSSWINLFRRSDPLGYRVFSDRDSHLDRPVPEVPLEQRGDPGPRVMTHSGYQHTRTYRDVVASWTGEHVVEDPVGTGDLPSLPPG